MELPDDDYSMLVGPRAYQAAGDLQGKFRRKSHLHHEAKTWDDRRRTTESLEIW